ncbi:hypothetical protein [Mangrovibacterium diazotrophicum]|uniref:Uncharacterized protein n=1 Tax=Mangrovibacterium diazotrophicum TaxID=1261403 RepID=A0A419W9I3_9BACT|nr:hypothetical protein [Mangrovibacterium diazotrophicum]RKD92109.1 hypothetical protein BC643_2479 [Mangrovibacterium diazotrophicum]
MKIRIENITNWRNVLLLAGATVFILIGFFEIVPGIEANWNRRILGVGLLLGAWFNLRILYMKHYIGYNGKGMFIRMGRFPGRPIRFKHVQNIRIEKGLLQIDLNGGEQLVVDLDEADPLERKELTQFLENRSLAAA